VAEQAGAEQAGAEWAGAEWAGAEVESAEGVAETGHEVEAEAEGVKEGWVVWGGARGATG
jgi:hypothetical protein